MQKLIDQYKLTLIKKIVPKRQIMTNYSIEIYQYCLTTK